MSITKSIKRKQLAIKLKSEGWSVVKISKFMEVHPSTVKRDLGQIKPPIRKRVHRPRIVDSWMKTRIKRAIHGVTNMSVRKTANALKKKHFQVSPTTIWRVSRSLGLQKKKNVKTFKVSKPQKKKRVEFSTRMSGVNLNNYIFIDESSLQLDSPPNSHNDGTWLFPQEQPHRIEVPKYPVKVSIIAGISKQGKSRLIFFDGTVNGARFTHFLMLILRDMRPLHGSSPLTLVFDSASPHRSKFTTNWLVNHEVKFIPKSEWPASSPDLNPIENVWSTLQAKVADCFPSSIAKLKRIAKKIWSTISPAPYVNTLPSRFKKIIASKGGQSTV